MPTLKSTDQRANPPCAAGRLHFPDRVSSEVEELGVELIEQRIGIQERRTLAVIGLQRVFIDEQLEADRELVLVEIGREKVRTEFGMLSLIAGEERSGRSVRPPFAADLDDSGLRDILGTVPHTPLDEGIRQDSNLYATLIAQDRIDLGQLET